MRMVGTNFWTDSKVVDEFTPEDKYFMLFCLTNQYTNLCGCYEISMKQISNELGYTKEVVATLLERFTNVHKVVEYDFQTKELFIRNWYKYNWNKSEKLDKPLRDAISQIKSDKFHDEVAKQFNQRETIVLKELTAKGKFVIPYRYPIDTL